MNIQHHRVLDLCCGGGYLSYGFTKAGYNLDKGIDVWETALQTYEKHLNAPGYQQDLATYYPSKQDYDVIIVSGTPCQDYALVNTNRNIYGKRAQLVLDFCRVVSAVKPEVFVFENVIHLSKWAESALFELENNGYKVTKNIVDTAFFNVPQRRRRKIFIGSKHRHIPIQNPPNPQIVTVREAFNKIPQNWGYTKHRPETVEKFKHVHSSSWISKEKTSTYQGTIRLQWDEPACAITNVKKAQILHPTEHRIITIAEAQALQSIPHWYIPEGTDTDKAIQIANAVPPQLAKHIATKITSTYQ